MYFKSRHMFGRRQVLRFMFIAFIIYFAYLTMISIFGSSSSNRDSGNRDSGGDRNDNEDAYKKRDEHEQDRLKVNKEPDQVIEPDPDMNRRREEAKNEKQAYDENIYDKYDNMKNYAVIKDNGALGKGMSMDGSKLVNEKKKLFDEGWSMYAFNHYASMLIPENRTLPDVRLEGCKSEIYSSDLPKASIIMCFHNEAWTVLIRGIYSVINRTPPHLLEEIILVDDFSDFEHVLKPLDVYLEEKFGNKVRVIRNSKREGLIRSRLNGANAAKGEVLLFLDSHIEATQGWIEPLLDLIKQDNKIVVTPLIDVIDKQTFEYKYSINSHVSVGGFDWGMQFTWHGLPDRLNKMRKSDHDPVPSPTMAGGLFAISKEYFEYLGTYDERKSFIDFSIPK